MQDINVVAYLFSSSSSDLFLFFHNFITMSAMQMFCNQNGMPRLDSMIIAGFISDMINVVLSCVYSCLGCNAVVCVGKLNEYQTRHEGVKSS